MYSSAYRYTWYYTVGRFLVCGRSHPPITIHLLCSRTGSYGTHAVGGFPWPTNGRSHRLICSVLVPVFVTYAVGSSLANERSVHPSPSSYQWSYHVYIRYLQAYTLTYYAVRDSRPTKVGPTHPSPSICSVLVAGSYGTMYVPYWVHG
jgi:hypothetical protein